MSSSTSPFDFLFQGSPPPSVTSETTNQQGFPSWYQDLMRANIGQASAAASQPYQTYPGQQVAATTAPTQQAWQLTQNNVGSQTPDLNSANSALQTAANGFNTNQFEQYENPYTQGVAQSIQTLGDQNLMQNVLPGVNDTFTGAGQFGSSRDANFNALAIENNQLGVSSAQEQALMSGTQQAETAYNTGQQNSILAGQQLGTLGQVVQNTGLKDAAALDQVGQEQQAQNQTNLNTAYQNWQNQVAYPENQVNFMNSIIRGVPAPTTSTGTAINPQTSYQGSNSSTNPSALSQAAATTGASGGLAGLAGSSVTASPIFVRTGGRIRKGKKYGE